MAEPNLVRTVCESLNMFKLFLISIVLVPCLIGVSAAKRNKSKGDLSALKVGWIIYITVWFSLLYYMKHKWAG